MGPGSRDQGKPPYPTLDPDPWNPVPVKRIYEQYTPGDQVEIIFTHLDQDTWQPAVVVRREPPGIWVRAADGRDWFMTNTYRIRPATASSEEL